MNFLSLESTTVSQSSAPAPERSTTFAAVSMPVKPLSGEDQARADLYALLARLFLAPPDAALLDALSTSEPILAQGGELALEQAWERLTMASSVMDPQSVQDEFDALFIGIGTPLLNPYGSRYIAGFINDTPLAELRADLARLGLARVQGTGEFEDHIGALCETMRVLVGGAPGVKPQPVEQQRYFFEVHIAPWYERAMNDIAGADGANYYRLVARLGAAFLDIEADAFAVEEQSNETA